MSEPGHTGPDREQDGEQEQPRLIVRDKRRFDPNTHERRETQATAAPGPGGAQDNQEVTEPEATAPAAEAAEVTEAKAALAERTGDLQRLQAEYVNYKRRVDRDRDVTRRAGIESVLKDILPVLDDLRSAREHEELSGGFKAVADEVERVAGKYGLEAFGQPGDPFDPHIHEALLHAHATGITGPTCVEILQPGYRIGEKVLRVARVAVAEPGPEEESAASSGAAPEPVGDAAPQQQSTADEEPTP